MTSRKEEFMTDEKILSNFADINFKIGYRKGMEETEKEYFDKIESAVKDARLGERQEFADWLETSMDNGIFYKQNLDYIKSKIKELRGGK